MNRVTSLLKNGPRVVRDLDLIFALRSEITQEQTAATANKHIQIGSLGDFKLDWDSPQTRDVVLRKRCDTGEEVAVSALLEFHEKEGNFLREVMMKVCIKKPGVSSVMQFDCHAYDSASEGSQFDIYNAYYLPSTTSPDPSIYRGPQFRSLNSDLQDELKNYLISKGIEKELIDFILCHTLRKEQGQYLNWLLKLQNTVERIDDQTENA